MRAFYENRIELCEERTLAVAHCKTAFAELLPCHVATLSPLPMPMFAKPLASASTCSVRQQLGSDEKQERTCLSISAYDHLRQSPVDVLNLSCLDTNAGLSPCSCTSSRHA